MRLFATTAVALLGASIFLTSASPAITMANKQFAIANINQPTTNLEVKAVPAAQPSPPPAPTPSPAVPPTVTVHAGDYLTKLAADNNTTSLRLFYANPAVTDPDLIFPAEVLRVPAATEQLVPRDVPVNQQIATPTTPQSTQAAQPQTSASSAPSAATGDVWDRIAACEAGGNWAINTGNGFYGGLQFTLSSWQAVGGSGSPSDASKSEQIARGQMLQARQGWGAWPVCSGKAGA
jgi:LysM repeat protein